MMQNKNDPILYKHEAGKGELVEPYTKKRLADNLRFFFEREVFYRISRDEELYREGRTQESKSKQFIPLPECVTDGKTFTIKDLSLTDYYCSIIFLPGVQKVSIKENEFLKQTGLVLDIDFSKR